jgi:hypothetical protein
MICSELIQDDTRYWQYDTTVFQYWEIIARNPIAKVCYKDFITYNDALLYLTKGVLGKYQAGNPY